MQAMDELGKLLLFTDPCDMGPCIIKLKHEVMVSGERHDNWPPVLITVSLHSN
jgi:hypothetical protein